jgi:SAM-dependent methyltransferase
MESGCDTLPTCPDDGLRYILITHPVKNGHALDMCAGSGRNTRLLLQQGYRVHAIDHRSDQVDALRIHQAEAVSKKQLTVETVDIFHNLPAHDLYDIVIVSYCLHAMTIARGTELLSHCATMVKRMGHLLVSGYCLDLPTADTKLKRESFAEQDRFFLSEERLAGVGLPLARYFRDRVKDSPLPRETKFGRYWVYTRVNDP